MGIFSRSPKVPPPDVTRTLSREPNKPYRPGSIVSGTIAVSCPTTRLVRFIRVQFYGQCITHSTRSENSGPNNNSTTIHYHDEVDLFRYDQDLTPRSGAFTAPEHQQMTFNFAFTFPATTDVLRPDVYERKTAGSDVYDVVQHELPPSYTLNYGSRTVADVLYRLDVSLLLDSDPDPYTVAFNGLDFQPLPPRIPAGLQAPFLEFVRKRETYASSRLIGQEKSFRASVRDKFSSHTPSLDVTMKASLVPVLTVGAPFELFVCVELAGLSDPKAIHLPTLSLKVKELRLYEDTRFRALRVSYGHHYPENERVEQNKMLLNALPDIRVVQQQPGRPPTYEIPAHQFDSKGMEKHQPSSSFSSSASTTQPQGSAAEFVYPTSFSARIPSDAVSSFRTVNINHHYRLRVELVVEIAGKEFEHEFEVDDVTVLPAADAAAGVGAP